MSDVEFEDDSSFSSYRTAQFSSFQADKEEKFAQFLVDQGIVSNTNQGRGVLIGISILGLLFSFFIFIDALSPDYPPGGTGETAEVYP